MFEKKKKSRNLDILGIFHWEFSKLTGLLVFSGCIEVEHWSEMGWDPNFGGDAWNLGM